MYVAYHPHPSHSRLYTFLYCTHHVITIWMYHSPLCSCRPAMWQIYQDLLALVLVPAIV